MRNANFAEPRCCEDYFQKRLVHEVQSVRLCPEAEIHTKPYVYSEMLRCSRTLVQIHCSNHEQAVAEETTAAERAALCNRG